MRQLNRRQTLFNIALASVALPTATASAQTPGASEGREIAPGVRRVDYSKRDTMIPNYKTVSMRDSIYQPGASTSGSSMANDMVCHMLEGELTVDTGSGDARYRKGDVWSCAKGMPERSKNTGSTVAVMRVIDLLPG
ncbi:cupin domain-containing protein [Microvirga terrae]|uniref:Cupin domain-containing protein n=1 Tax=Microvirga terrae TaxID=2740529 RepID=A0ABY5RLN7_9HYPH|nr:cupin domain-containing protein [Microvirga terrae]UVF17893.1 cupin domain-containing protein [Microvirga terrae]